MSPEELINKAFEAQKYAYAPYSHFAVGAALLTAEGEVHTGCNIENASYGLTVCAERVAILKAVSCGQRSFKSMAVIADTEEFCSPCGACRQVLSEFGGDIKVYLANRRGEYRTMTVGELLPGAFSLSKSNNQEDA
ncbi:cytidine deaminase [Desulfotruncus alcoholivorax]|uniref:cytidine deaminase n=1 Tax=Desulfotruncus alcoholivorax TaxID=265477 RepID=UPI0003F82256|nr:cytidine deaminase [Desulfotruncus alcoholivorax]